MHGHEITLVGSRNRRIYSRGCRRALDDGIARAAFHQPASDAGRSPASAANRPQFADRDAHSDTTQRYPGCHRAAGAAQSLKPRHLQYFICSEYPGSSVQLVARARTLRDCGQSDRPDTFIDAARIDSRQQWNDGSPRRATRRVSRYSATRISRAGRLPLPASVGPPVSLVRSAGLSKAIEFNGQITLTARPELRPEWRLDPNLTAQVSIGDVQLSIMGRTINLSDQLKSLAERIIAAQVAAFQAQSANSPMLEQGVREQWAKLCHTIPLGSGPPGTPDLWLELRPTRALASQPRIDEAALTLILGMRAETRIVTAETKPDCPFPSQLDIVRQMDRGPGYCRPADRHSFHRGRPADRGTAEGKDLPPGQERSAYGDSPQA